MQEWFSLALSSLNSYKHMGRKIKKEAFLLAFSKQQVVVCKAQAFKIQMLKTKFSGLDSNIIYKAQISLFTHVTVNRVVAAGGAGAAVVLVALLQIHLC